MRNYSLMGLVDRSQSIRLDHVQEETGLGDAHLLESLIQGAGPQGGPVQVHGTAGVVHAVALQEVAHGGVLVDDLRLTIDIVPIGDLTMHYSHGSLRL